MGTEAAKTFALAQMAVVFGPVDLKPGAGEGGFLKITPNAPAFNVVTGVNGSVLRTFTNERMVKIEITLLQSSKTNDALTAIHQADIASCAAGNGGIMLPFIVVDLGGALAFASPKAWIMSLPEVARSNKNGDVTWTIMAADGKEFVGGN